jgi:uncharacterized membrane protein
MELLTPPPLPPYEGLHPIVVHFPIALLAVVPLCIALGMLWRSQTRGLMLAATLLCTVGTGAAFLAVSTGEASEKFAKGVLGADAILHDHEEAAELARNLFVALTFVVATATGIAYRLGDRLNVRLRLMGGLVLLILCAGPVLVLANAAHLGGRLVHEYGVRAPIATGVRAPVPVAPGEDDED